MTKTLIELPKNLENLNEKQKESLLEQYLDSIVNSGYTGTFSENFFNLLNNKRFCSIVLKQIYSYEKTKIENSILNYEKQAEKYRKELIILQEQKEANKEICQSIIEKMKTKEFIEEKYKENITSYEYNLLGQEEEISNLFKEYSNDASKLKSYNVIKKYKINRKLCKLTEQLYKIEQIKSLKHLSNARKYEIEILEQDIALEKSNIEKLSFAKDIEEKINTITTTQELIQKEKKKLNDIKNEYKYYLDSTDITEKDSAIINLITEYYAKDLGLYDLGNYIDNVLYNNDPCDDYEYDPYNQQMYLSKEAYDRYTKEQEKLRKAGDRASKEYNKLNIELIASLEKLNYEVARL
ncbi:MAG TPA: hypothetical protein LFW20_02415 [Rickettsia endosymbiont of Omalisus fontisbellaquei]|nr:hypothetical protein [Rickettsia endosymbiont of Omalisus fontisbellaquei]